MCTAVSYCPNQHYFGRNLDLEYSYNEAVTIVPRNFPLAFRRQKTLSSHYAMIGMAIVVSGYPLFFDATNEKGLSMAGLNFPDNAAYYEEVKGKDNISPFEFIPWVLAQCKNVAEAKGLLENINLAEIPFSKDLPLSPLHWIIADPESTIVVESVKDGLKVYDNPVHVLTNNPPFEYHLHNLNNYLHCTAGTPDDHFFPAHKLKLHSKGMGGIGLPGDFSSPSRFVKAAFVSANSKPYESESENVCAFFRILNSVAMPEGCILTPEGAEKTVYSSCCNTSTCKYYYTTDTNPSISCVSLFSENLDSSVLRQFPLQKNTVILYQNNDPNDQ